MILHTFGDSHSGHADGLNWRAIDIRGLKIKSHWIGARTCAVFGARQFGILNIADHGVKNGDWVCFSFGEIDCRAHIHKQKDDWRGLILMLVDKYIEAVMANVEQFEGLTIMIMCVPPVARKSVINDNPQFPTLGSNEERKTYTEYMNDRLKLLCDKAGYIFFDVYDDYCDEEGYLNMDLSDGNVHIRDSRYMEEKLIKIYDEISK